VKNRAHPAMDQAMEAFRVCTHKSALPTMSALPETKTRFAGVSSAALLATAWWSHSTNSGFRQRIACRCW
jgi:hypothetical protein